MKHIRENVLQLTQSAMADVADVTQATVSRWESDELDPDREQMARIRDEAHARGIAWDDSWFFSVPETAPEEARAPCG